MVKIERSNQRKLEPLDVQGAAVHVSDPIIGRENCLSAGFTEYVAPSRLEWTFDYHEIFYVLDGSLDVEEAGQAGVTFKAGDLGYIEKGTRATISVPERALLLHVTQPAWRD